MFPGVLLSSASSITMIISFSGCGTFVMYMVSFCSMNIYYLKVIFSCVNIFLISLVCTWDICFITRLTLILWVCLPLKCVSFVDKTCLGFTSAYLVWWFWNFSGGVCMLSFHRLIDRVEFVSAILSCISLFLLVFMCMLRLICPLQTKPIYLCNCHPSVASF